MYIYIRIYVSTCFSFFLCVCLVSLSKITQLRKYFNAFFQEMLIMVQRIDECILVMFLILEGLWSPKDPFKWCIHLCWLIASFHSRKKCQKVNKVCSAFSNKLASQIPLDWKISCKNVLRVSGVQHLPDGRNIEEVVEWVWTVLNVQGGFNNYWVVWGESVILLARLMMRNLSNMFLTLKILGFLGSWNIYTDSMYCVKDRQVSTSVPRSL